jgi:hypothetical protein
MRCKASQQTEINRQHPQNLRHNFSEAVQLRSAAAPLLFEFTQRISPLQDESARSPKRGPPTLAFLRFESCCRGGCQRPLVSNEKYFLASKLRNDILERLNLNHIYEKICLVINHGPNRHRVYCFLHATAGDNRNLDNSGNGQGLAVAIAGKKEEDHHEEEGNDRRIAFACGGCRIAFADALKNVEVRS